MRCVECKKEAAGDRLPGGWKRTDDVYCNTCWGKKYVLRAMTFVISGPAAEGKTWADLREALRAAWQDTTQLMNWAVSEYCKADKPRKPRDKSLKGMKDPYLYPKAVRLFPGVACGSVSGLLQMAWKKYSKARKAVVWERDASPPYYRYPCPWHVRKQELKLEYQEYEGRDGHVSRRPVVCVPIGKERWTLALRGGSEFRRQLAGFRQIVEGAALKGPLEIYQRPCSRGRHRSGGQARSPGGGGRFPQAYLAKVVGWFPRGDQATGTRTMGVKTYPSGLWAAEIEGKEAWVFNADHVRRWCAEHRLYLRRTSQDLKFERRLAQGKRAQLEEFRSARCEKHNNRLDSFAHEASAYLAKYAERNNVGRVIYDDRCQTFVESFPWSRLKSLIGEKLDARGIAFWAGEDREGLEQKGA